MPTDTQESPVFLGNPSQNPPEPMPSGQPWSFAPLHPFRLGPWPATNAGHATGLRVGIVLVDNVSARESRELNELPSLAQHMRSELSGLGAGGIGRSSRSRSRIRRVVSMDRSRELRWIREHSVEYAGKWVALDGDTLIASGESAAGVFAAVDKQGVKRPYFVHLEPPDSLPFGGW